LTTTSSQLNLSGLFWINSASFVMLKTKVPLGNSSYSSSTGQGLKCRSTFSFPAKRDLKLARALKQYARYEALIIDDIGYVQQSREEMEVLFTLLADRYERSSVMITSNLSFSKWEQIFKDPMTTAAAIDRLVHHSVILELNIPSYRLEESHKAQAQAEPQQDTK
jgi:hypothetical protein